MHYIIPFKMFIWQIHISHVTQIEGLFRHENNL